MHIGHTILRPTEPASDRLNRGNGLFSLAFLLCMMALLPACARVNIYHGHSVKQAKISALQIGRTTKDQVIQSLGSPTCVLSYDPHTLYYLSQVVASQALLKIEPVSSKCFALTFSPSGILSKIVCSTAPYRVVCCKASMTLPSSHQEGFWQQVVRSFEKSPPTTSISPV